MIYSSVGPRTITRFQSRNIGEYLAMPRKYVRKTVDKYSKVDLEKAIGLVRNEKFSVAVAAKECNIPERTLYNRLSNTNGDGGRGAKPILAMEEEKLLVHTITIFQQWQQPLSRSSLIELAKCYMTELNKPISIKSTLYDWFESFMKRWGNEIKVVKSMKLEKIRSTSCTKEVVGKKRIFF